MQFWRTRDATPIGPPVHCSGDVLAVTSDGTIALTVVRRAVGVDDQPVLAGGLTGAWTGVAQLCRTPDGTPIGPPLNHPARVTGAWFSPDDQTILTVDSNYLLRLWSVPNGARIGPVYQSTSPVTGTLFAPNSQTVLINSLRGVVQLREQPRPVAGAPDR